MLPEEMEAMKVETKGEFAGLGIEVSADKNGILQVIASLKTRHAQGLACSRATAS